HLTFAELLSERIQLVRSGGSLECFWFSLPTRVSVIISPRTLSTTVFGYQTAIFHDPLQATN
ncbi:MAG: hypothetical protein ACKOA8_19255, partial [Deltaproteobacteria bacterium]